MINQPEPLKSKIDYFDSFREQKQPKTAPKLVFMVIHDKEMIFMTIKKAKPHSEVNRAILR